MAVQYITVQDLDAGQRIDNYLLKKMKGVPKARLYRALRKGEVRVNKKRVKAVYRVAADDEIRIPPLKTKSVTEVEVGEKLIKEILQQIIYEDEHLFVLNKPSGFAVHKGTNVRLGIIDILQAYFVPKPIYLVHRIDRETSGCLLLAKDRDTLAGLHELMREHVVEKQYIAMLEGNVGAMDEELVDAPLKRLPSSQPDKAKAIVSEDGQMAQSYFTTLAANSVASLVNVRIATGRMHQIRAHTKYIGHPVAGDRRYGDESYNAQMRKYGLERLFLHAEKVAFRLHGKNYKFVAKLPADLVKVKAEVFGGS